MAVIKKMHRRYMRSNASSSRWPKTFPVGFRYVLVPAPSPRISVSEENSVEEMKRVSFRFWVQGGGALRSVSPLDLGVLLGSGLGPASNTRWLYHCSPVTPLQHRFVQLKIHLVTSSPMLPNVQPLQPLFPRLRSGRSMADIFVV